MAILRYSTVTAVTGYMANGANDDGLCAEELCEVSVSRL